MNEEKVQQANPRFAEIILPLSLRQTYTYAIPTDFAPVRTGMRVLVPFRGAKLYTGIVKSVFSEPAPEFRVKELYHLLDPVPLISQLQLQHWTWMAQYYLCSIGDIMRYALPGSLKLESQTYIRWIGEADTTQQELSDLEKLIIDAMVDRPVISLKEIEAFIPRKDLFPVVGSLISQRYIALDEKVQETYKIKESSWLHIPEAILSSQYLGKHLQDLSRAPQQRELFLHLLELQQSSQKGFVKKSLVMEKGFGSSVLKGLKEKGLVDEILKKEERIQSFSEKPNERPCLSPAQQIAWEKMKIHLDKAEALLLHGPPASGKTHLYLEAILDILKQGKSALYLMPETSLTQHTIQRLQNQFGDKLAYYHSKLSDAEKTEIWQKVHSGEKTIILGTRKAIFLPIQNLALVIIDEEHDAAYRIKDQNPDFQGRDAAWQLARISGAGVILGSASPSVELIYAVGKKKLNYVQLKEKFSSQGEVKTTILDIGSLKEKKEFSGLLSDYAAKRISEEVETNALVQVFFNKRGYSSVIECQDCGYIQYCSNCDVVLTYHKVDRGLKCHYCGLRAPIPKQCPKCHSEKLSDRGLGIQQVQENFQARFPEVRIERMDTDAMKGKYAYAKLFERIEAHQVDLLLGTQMMAKGLDFPDSNLMLVPLADQLLYGQDYRSAERSYQTLIQLSGRVGRHGKNGEIIVQTFTPTHPAIQFLQNPDYAALYRQLLSERKAYHYPPYTRLISITLKHRRQDKLERASAYLASLLRQQYPEEMVMGPAFPQIARLNTWYQMQVFLKFPKNQALHLKRFLPSIIDEFYLVQAYQSIRCHITVDV